MRKPWSIATAVRNPGRLRNFLAVLQQLENSEWHLENQKKYQILLIQNRMYGYGSPQFYKGLSEDQIELIDDVSKGIPFETAEEIFYAKGYEDPAMRGRQSVNPLKKMGLVTIENKKIRITDSGKLLLKKDFDYEDVFFRSFLKWQIPNPDSRDYPKNGGYDIKPFIGTLHLIHTVNKKEIARGSTAKGLSKEEFSLFAPALIHYRDIDSYAAKIIAVRDELSEKARHEKGIIFDAHKKQFASEFLGTDNEAEITKLLKNLKDYGDNAIRYFRLTKHIHIRGGGFYIDLEPRRSVEIESLLADDNAQSKSFKSKEEYLAYIADISEPQLPWETEEKHFEIIKRLVEDIRSYETALQKEKIEVKEFQTMTAYELINCIKELRGYRRELQDEEIYRQSQAVEQLESYIEDLENIYDFEDRPILLEKLSALGLQALNDAIKISPNYPVGDDNEPTFTAPANTPDIECFYESFNAVCEVTMQTGRAQWYHEGQPVMRHLRDFEKRHKNKPSYCLFIAPKLHRDTVNTFWTAIKYEYEGQPQRIIPLSIQHFALILKILLQLKTEEKFLKHSDISRLYNDILDSSNAFNNSSEWLKSIPNTISLWQESLISQV